MQGEKRRILRLQPGMTIAVILSEAENPFLVCFFIMFYDTVNII